MTKEKKSSFLERKRENIMSLKKIGHGLFRKGGLKLWILILNPIFQIL